MIQGSPNDERIDNLSPDPEDVLDAIGARLQVLQEELLCLQEQLRWLQTSVDDVRQALRRDGEQSAMSTLQQELVPVAMFLEAGDFGGEGNHDASRGALGVQPASRGELLGHRFGSWDSSDACVGRSFSCGDGW